MKKEENSFCYCVIVLVVVVEECPNLCSHMNGYRQIRNFLTLKKNLVGYAVIRFNFTYCNLSTST